MVRAVALGLAVLALFPTLALAHGPTRQKVTVTVEINAPADKVWAVIGNFQDMSWHPIVAKVEGIPGGISTGANVAAALSIAERPEYKGKMIVTFAPSSAERYFSSDLFLDPGK